MRELIKVTLNNEGVQVISARELHEGLEVKSKFADWIKNRINKYGFEKDEDYIIVNLASKNVEASWGGNNRVDYIITTDMAKELCMVENNELGRQYRKYFIECEKQLKERNNKQLPKDYLSALKELVASEEARIKAEEERDKLIHQGKLYNTCEIAKELGFRSARQLNKILEEKGIQYKNNGTWLLKADYSELGYTSTKQLVLDNGYITYDRKWTGTGRDFILDLFNKGDK